MNKETDEVGPDSRKTRERLRKKKGENASKCRDTREYA